MTKFKPIIFLAVLFLSACTKEFEQINTNPNSPDKVNNPGVLFTNAIRGAVNSNFEHSFNRGSIAGDLLFNDFAGNYNNWVRADASGYFLWSYYDYIRDLNEVIILAEAD